MAGLHISKSAFGFCLELTQFAPTMGSASACSMQGIAGQSVPKFVTIDFHSMQLMKELMLEVRLVSKLRTITRKFAPKPRFKTLSNSLIPILKSFIMT